MSDRARIRSVRSSHGGVGVGSPGWAAPQRVRASLHPEGLAAHTVGFDQWAAYLLDQLHRLVTVTDDPGLAAIEREVTGYPNIIELRERIDWTNPDAPPALLVPYRLDLGDVELSMFTTLTTFGTPRDVTLDELAIELFYPNDRITSDYFHQHASATLAGQSDPATAASNNATTSE